MTSSLPSSPVFERVGLTRGLASEQLGSLARHAVVKTVPRGRAAWWEGESAEDFAFVVQGRFKLSKVGEGGRDTILELVTAGESLCTSVACQAAPYCCSAIALEDSEVLRVPRRSMLDLAGTIPHVALALLAEGACRSNAMCRRIEELAGGRVEQRIAMLLLKLVDRAGRKSTGTAVFVPIPLTRRDIADLCGTTIETAIRVMSRFNKQGVVKTTAKGFVVRDRIDLLQRVRGSAGPLAIAG